MTPPGSSRSASPCAASLDQLAANHDAAAFLDLRRRVTSYSGATPSPEAGRERAANRTNSRPAHPIIATHLGEAP